MGKLNANKIYADLKTDIPNIKLRSLTLGVFIGMSVAYFTDLAILRGLFTLVIAMLLWVTSIEYKKYMNQPADEQKIIDGCLIVCGGVAGCCVAITKQATELYKRKREEFKYFMNNRKTY